jgi:hypothetical protein
LGLFAKRANEHNARVFGPLVDFIWWRFPFPDLAGGSAGQFRRRAMKYNLSADQNADLFAAAFNVLNNVRRKDGNAARAFFGKEFREKHALLRVRPL